ncbi:MULTISPECIES: accessory factor UbiK family protein [Eikenella]|uniref:Ubiquinone biosynthesis accessory factor UbiK n=1 Tax=Eikenella exigua TaxID=2528037 RepID=A0AAX1F8T5_9NEIS|nr:MULTISPECIES: accessory factor UbiK family protein [Eikenella]OAM28614.1 phosphoheptose isomerase [Eikenella sp. NML01-A-086]OAM41258.1 phosphoheptose isomerase [Eikenella sp. NML97-A-109]QED92168.1 accessory factor UbiK family protein [Eikenella exigua]
MLAKQFLDELAGKIGSAIAESPVKDVEKNVKTLLGSTFSKLDLVTREEFNIQQQVLVKTREKLAALEARLAKLEANAPAALPNPSEQQ